MWFVADVSLLHVVVYCSGSLLLLHMFVVVAEVVAVFVVPCCWLCSSCCCCAVAAADAVATDGFCAKRQQQQQQQQLMDAASSSRVVSCAPWMTSEVSCRTKRSSNTAAQCCTVPSVQEVGTAGFRNDREVGGAQSIPTPPITGQSMGNRRALLTEVNLVGETFVH